MTTARSSTPADPFGARARLGVGERRLAYYRLDRLPTATVLGQLPMTVKILLENVLRHAGGGVVTPDEVRALAAWTPRSGAEAEIPSKIFDYLGARREAVLFAPADYDVARLTQAMPSVTRIDPADRTATLGWLRARLAAQARGELDRRPHRERPLEPLAASFTRRATARGLAAILALVTPSADDAGPASAVAAT